MIAPIYPSLLVHWWPTSFFFLWGSLKTPLPGCDQGLSIWQDFLSVKAVVHIHCIQIVRLSKGHLGGLLILAVLKKCDIERDWAEEMAQCLPAPTWRPHGCESGSSVPRDRKSFSSLYRDCTHVPDPTFWKCHEFSIGHASDIPANLISLQL